MKYKKMKVGENRYLPHKHSNVPMQHRSKCLQHTTDSCRWMRLPSQAAGYLRDSSDKKQS